MADRDNKLRLEVKGVHKDSDGAIIVLRLHGDVSKYDTLDILALMKNGMSRMMMLSSAK
jgi:hypothetical protein